MKLEKRRQRNSGERTLQAWWSSPYTATNFPENANYSLGEEFTKSSCRQNAETSTLQACAPQNLPYHFN
jgi:hypothetical protein